MAWLFVLLVFCLRYICANVTLAEFLGNKSLAQTEPLAGVNCDVFTTKEATPSGKEERHLEIQVTFALRTLLPLMDTDSKLVCSTNCTTGIDQCQNQPVRLVSSETAENETKSLITVSLDLSSGNYADCEGWSEYLVWDQTPSIEFDMQEDSIVVLRCTMIMNELYEQHVVKTEDVWYILYVCGILLSAFILVFVMIYAKEIRQRFERHSERAMDANCYN